MWPGWIEWGGVEIVNATRTETYAKHARLPWFHPIYQADDLPLLLGETYTSALQDDPPWSDPNDPDTYGFHGCYPLDVAGLEDATTTAQVTESVADGGVVGRARLATRSVVFNLALVGVSERAVGAGLRWLKAVVSAPPCGIGDRSCSGQTLCFLSAEPCVDEAGCAAEGVDPTSCLPQWQRWVRRAAVTSGPTVTSKMTLGDGAAWVVSMTVTVGDPFCYGSQVDLVRGFPIRDDPYVGGAPDGAVWDNDGHIEQEVKCSAPSYQPVVDPLCPIVIPPPGLPPMRLDCFDFPSNFVRRTFSIPGKMIPLWTDLVPVIEVHTTNKEARSLRVRFYADVSGDGSPDDDPCAYCGDIIFSYVPADSTLTFDGAEQTVYVQTQGGPSRRADALVFGSDGTPFEWPQLTCGYGYVVAVDVPQSGPIPRVDLSLLPRSA